MAKITTSNYRLLLCLISLLAHITILILNYIYKEQSRWNEETHTIIQGIFLPMTFAILANLIDSFQKIDKKYEDKNMAYILVIFIVSTIFVLAQAVGTIYFMVRESLNPDNFSYFIRALLFLEAFIPLALSDIFRNISYKDN